MESVFTGNRTRLKVVGLERKQGLGSAGFTHERILPNITCLDMSFDPLATNRTVVVDYCNVLAFACMLPNL